MTFNNKQPDSQILPKMCTSAHCITVKLVDKPMNIRIPTYQFPMSTLTICPLNTYEWKPNVRIVATSPKTQTCFWSPGWAYALGFGQVVEYECRAIHHTGHMAPGEYFRSQCDAPVQIPGSMNQKFPGSHVQIGYNTPDQSRQWYTC